MEMYKAPALLFQSDPDVLRWIHEARAFWALIAVACITGIVVSLSKTHFRLRWLVITVLTLIFLFSLIQLLWLWFGS